MSVVELADQHAAKLVERRAELSALDEEIAEIQSDVEEARLDHQRMNFGERSDGPGKKVTQLLQKLDKLVGQRERLAADVRAMEQIGEEIEEQAEAERVEAELRAAEQEISDAETNVADRWAEAVSLARKFRDAWDPLCAAIQALDDLPAGELPSAPMPGDCLKAFELALRDETGTDAFAALSRVLPKRLPIVRSPRVGPQDTTGYARTMQDTGAWR